MARAGWCSACNNYVFLRPDGGCGNGHDAAYISNTYELPEGTTAQVGYQAQQPSATPQAYAPATTQVAPGYPAAAPGYPPAMPQAAPGYPPATPQAYPQAYAAAAAPPKKRGGVIAAVLIVLALVLCGVGVGIGAMAGLIPNPLALLSSPAHQKVAVAGDFIEAFSTANLILLRGSIPSEAANAADPAFWTEKVLKDNPGGKVLSRSWNGDTLVMVVQSKDGEKTEFVLNADAAGDTVSVLNREVGSTDPGNEPTVLTMKQELTGWKVLALGSADGEEILRFDAAGIKKLQDENQ